MSPDTWALVDFTVPLIDSDLVADVLWSMGVLAIEEKAADPGLVTLRTSLGDDPVDHIVRVCAQFEGATASIIHLPTSVSETWRHHATITMVTEEVGLVPAWVGVPADITPILIEPRDTFGLGNHPTTVLALRMALKHTASSDKVLDFGCGSGVLAIGIARLVGSECDVFDIAETARSTVQENCRLNGVSTVRWTEEFGSNHYDVVIANILAPVLREEAATIIGTTRSGGVVILSGLRDDQVDGVLAHYPQMVSLETDTLDGWTCIALRKEAGGV